MAWVFCGMSILSLIYPLHSIYHSSITWNLVASQIILNTWDLMAFYRQHKAKYAQVMIWNLLELCQHGSVDNYCMMSHASDAIIRINWPVVFFNRAHRLAIPIRCLLPPTKKKKKQQQKNSQIWQCSASDKYPTMHPFVTEMCTHVHISVTKWCIVYMGLVHCGICASDLLLQEMHVCTSGIGNHFFQ